MTGNESIASVINTERIKHLSLFFHPQNSCFTSSKIGWKPCTVMRSSKDLKVKLWFGYLLAKVTRIPMRHPKQVPRYNTSDPLLPILKLWGKDSGQRITRTPQIKPECITFIYLKWILTVKEIIWEWLEPLRPSVLHTTYSNNDLLINSSSWKTACNRTGKQ